VLDHTYQVGDVVRLKKAHPCGGWDWEILRVGMDFRLRCLSCGHQIMLPRKEAEKRIKSLVQAAKISSSEK